MWGVEGETHDDGEAVDDTGDEDIDDREDGEMIGEHFPLSLLPMGTLAQLRSSASVTETSEALVTLGKFIKNIEYYCYQDMQFTNTSFR